MGKREYGFQGWTRDQAKLISKSGRDTLDTDTFVHLFSSYP